MNLYFSVRKSNFPQSIYRSQKPSVEQIQILAPIKPPQSSAEHSPVLFSEVTDNIKCLGLGSLPAKYYQNFKVNKNLPQMGKVN